MLADVIKQAQKRHREVVEQTYEGVCGVYERQAVKDPVTKVTGHKEVMVRDNIPCHLSYSSVSPVSDSGTVTSVSQTIKLFLAPEIVVLPGSRIEVTQQGRTGSYGQSGKAAVYSSHQEILLELWKEHA